jgi:DNA primase
VVREVPATTDWLVESAEKYAQLARERAEHEEREYYRRLSDAELVNELEYLERELAELRLREQNEDHPDAVAILEAGRLQELRRLGAEVDRRSALMEQGARWRSAPARFDRDFPRQLKDRLDLAEFLVWSHQLPLKRSGAHSYTCRCPFHDDRTPSFTVNTGTGLWHCFGCRRGGDVFTYLQQIGTSFADAVHIVANYLGIPVRAS